MNIRRSLLVKMVLSFVSIMLSAVVIISAFTYYGNVEILQTEYNYGNDCETIVWIRCIHYDMCKRAYRLDRDVQL